MKISVSLEVIGINKLANTIILTAMSVRYLWIAISSSVIIMYPLVMEPSVYEFDSYLAAFFLEIFLYIFVNN